jgi:murein L,D-transpeptidase YcbB/YkuD
VQWLRQSLAALDPDGKLRPGDSDLFDGELEQQLLEFQRRNRLDTDGLAGQQTQIIINSQLGLDGRPRLSGT